MAVRRSSAWSSAVPAPAVLRAGAILDMVGGAKGEAVTIAELAARANLPRSSVMNICVALIELGFLQSLDGGLVLGPRLAELGMAYLDALDVGRMFRDRCAALGALLEETAQLAVLDQLDVVYLARVDGPTPVPVRTWIGRRLPAYCTALGKAILAELDPKHVRELLAAAAPLAPMTRNTRTSIGDVMAELAATRERGYGINDEETTEGIFGVAMPVRGLPPSAGPYAVSISMLKARANKQRVDRALEVLRQLSDLVSDPDLATP
ncbi:IclR family transcriptional regulator [Plantactinospora sp. ZYX-F-223]|uniref:IclR family transcriptional regulator n=1 Tax=Plantactinospora sp. ZYX-F-223 TaxID=3144103 RepID=UPI0031FBEB58